MDEVKIKAFDLNEPFVGIFGEVLTGSKLDDITVAFKYPYYNTEFDMKPKALTGTGSIGVANQLLTVSGGSNGTAKAQSKRNIRYRAGHTGTAAFTGRFVGNGNGWIGPCDTEGFRIRSNNGIIYTEYVKNNVPVSVPHTEWHGEVDASTIDFTKINIFAVVFGYLGVASPIFLIRKDGWRVLNVMQTEGTLESTHIGDPSFPITAYAESNMTIETASWNGGVINGSLLWGSRPFQGTGSITLNGTNTATLGTFINKTTYKGVTNKVQAQAVRYHYHIDAPASGYGTVEIKIIKNATLSGTPNYIDVDEHNSIIAFDTAQTYNTGGRTLLTDWIDYSSQTGAGSKSGGDIAESAMDFDLYLLPGETATVTAKNVAGTTNVNVRMAFNWIELWS